MLLEDVDRVSKEAQLADASTKPPSVYTEPSWAGRGEFRGALAGGPPEEESPLQARSQRFPQTAPRKGPPASGTETPATCSYHWRSWFNSIPPHPHSQGVLLPELQGWFKPCVCIREAFQEGWDR